MHVIMRTPRQPRFDDRGFVGSVIVHDNVDVEAIRNLRVDLFKKIEKLGGSVALVAFTDHKSGRNVEGREKRCCAVTDIGMGPAFWNAGHHRQDRLFAIESLYLTLLVDAEHQRAIGRR